MEKYLSSGILRIGSPIINLCKAKIYKVFMVQNETGITLANVNSPGKSSGYCAKFLSS